MPTEIISHFKERPKTETSWRAMGFGLTAILSGPIMGIFAAVGRPIIDNFFGEKVGVIAGFVLVGVILVIVISALVFSISAYRKGERSWVMWVGLVPAIFASMIWASMIIGEFLFPH